MHKERPKKLTIARETLRSLSASQMTEAAGGITGRITFRSDCSDCHSYTDCITCYPTATCV